MNSDGLFDECFIIVYNRSQLRYSLDLRIKPGSILNSMDSKDYRVHWLDSFTYRCIEWTLHTKVDLLVAAWALGHGCRLAVYKLLQIRLLKHWNLQLSCSYYHLSKLRLFIDIYPLKRKVLWLWWQGWNNSDAFTMRQITPLHDTSLQRQNKYNFDRNNWCDWAAGLVKKASCWCEMRTAYYLSQYCFNHHYIVVYSWTNIPQRDYTYVMQHPLKWRYIGILFIDYIKIEK